jgi:Methyltransferase domain
VDVLVWRRIHLPWRLAGGRVATMGLSSRKVLPEMLDSLDPADPRAGRSRRDLRRVHRAMRTVAILQRALANLPLTAPPRRILEMGGGDGSLTLRLAQAMWPRWLNVTLTILDLHDVVSPQTRQGYETLGWRLQVVRQNAMDWAIESQSQHYDLCITSLFLHHFDVATLPVLLRAIAANCDSFVACEPRRNAWAVLGGAMIGLLGTNRVTREDAATSVAAGFTRQELTAIWQDLDGHWVCEEYPALPFTHCFTATRVRHATRTTAP